MGFEKNPSCCFAPFLLKVVHWHPPHPHPRSHHWQLQVIDRARDMPTLQSQGLGISLAIQNVNNVSETERSTVHRRPATRLYTFWRQLPVLWKALRRKSKGCGHPQHIMHIHFSVTAAPTYLFVFIIQGILSHQWHNHYNIWNLHWKQVSPMNSSVCKHRISHVHNLPFFQLVVQTEGLTPVYIICPLGRQRICSHFTCS